MDQRPVVTGAVCPRPGGLELTGNLQEVAGLPLDAAALDVSCGAGAAVALPADEHGLITERPNASPERVAHAADARSNLRFVVSWAESLPFPGASFDGVLCECVLSTLADPGPALDEMVCVLRPGRPALVSEAYVRSGSEVADGGGGALGTSGTMEGMLTAAGLMVSVWRDESSAATCGTSPARAHPPRSQRRGGANPATGGGTGPSLVGALNGRYERRSRG